MITENHVMLEKILGAPISRDEALEIIYSDIKASLLFEELEEERQEDILAFVQGIKGLPILYDGFYKHILDPERHPERLESFLASLLGQQIKIEQVMPQEGVRLAEGGSFVVMDIIVRLEDGSVVNVELQKQGYLFPGERSDCYLSDMIMRQYNRIKEEKGKAFRYKDMKPVYLIILMERSSKEFKEVSPYYIHRVNRVVDSGVKINFLSNLLYVSLDTFHQVSQNISSKTEAWLTFLSSDKPADIIRLIEHYPEFKECYHDIAIFRKNPKELLTMFSKALYEMDRNTEKYMVEELQKEIEDKTKILQDMSSTIEDMDKTIEDMDKTIEDMDKVIEEKDRKIEELQKELSQLKEKN